MKKGTIITALLAFTIGATAQVETSTPVAPQKDTVPVKLSTDTMFTGTQQPVSTMATKNTDPSYIEKYKQDSVLNALHNSPNRWDSSRNSTVPLNSTNQPLTNTQPMNTTVPLNSNQPLNSTPINGSQPLTTTPMNSTQPMASSALGSTQPVNSTQSTTSSTAMGTTSPMNAGSTTATTDANASVYSAGPTTYHPLDNGRVSIVLGQTYITSNNRAQLVTKDITLTDGTVVMADGTIKKTNGKTVKLKNGQGYSYGQSQEKSKETSTNKKDQ